MSKTPSVRRPEQRRAGSSVGDQSTFTSAWVPGPSGEVLLEDAERRRGGGGRSVAAVLDHGADDELRVVGRPVAAPPRLILEVADGVAGKVDDLLGRSRLAGDRDRVRAEDARRRPVRRVGRGPEPLADGLRARPGRRRRHAAGREGTASASRAAAGWSPAARRPRRRTASRACRRSRSSRRSAPSAAASR